MTSWLLRALLYPLPTIALQRVRCNGKPVDIDAVIDRFPHELERLVYAEPLSDFRERLARMIKGHEELVVMLRRKRWALEASDLLLALGAAGTTYAVADHLASTPYAALLAAIAGLGTAGVRALKLRGVRFKT